MVPARSAKNRRPSGAHASAVGNSASSTNTDSPRPVGSVAAGDAHSSLAGVGGGWGVGPPFAVVLGAAEVLVAFPGRADGLEPQAVTATATSAAATHLRGMCRGPRPTTGRRQAASTADRM